MEKKKKKKIEKIQHREREKFRIKRISLVLKVTLIIVHFSIVFSSFINTKRFKIGGQTTISIDTIQSSILGCRLPRPALVGFYTAKKVFQELEMAKEEYIQMNMRIYKEQRLLVPKNVECFVKEMGLSQLALAEMLDHSMPHSLVNRFHQGKLSKKVDWIPHSFAFRYMLSNQLVQ
ncbi:hypothetical protein MIMGU_mgv1a018715mg [Erythranthe guttata]|uniref:Uncharacterized protein n=1 Tax=Erythranthe guttata TaxID=4155 RepID=A0A022QSH3_ERYGU|nr:hypothetical protein MIMGU_mgv1a018715mg [Erythranthe guttata]